jgi:FkbM family methyltransferase
MARKVVQRIVGPELAVDIRGIRVMGGPEHGPYLENLRTGRAEPFMMELFRQAVVPGATVLDAGAFVGSYTLLAAGLVGSDGTILAFEPDVRKSMWLRRNVDANGFSSRVTVSEDALTDQAGTATFFLQGGDQTTSSLYISQQSVGGVEVRCVALDDILDPTARLDVGKIDVEGAEVRALRGMRRTIAASPALSLFVECNPHALDAAGSGVLELVDLVRDLGLEPRRIDEAGKRLLPVGTGREIEQTVNLLCRPEEA